MLKIHSDTIWLFDLDNTLHHADAGIFQLINHCMTAFLAQKLDLSSEAASDLREDYWHRYGATLAGLNLHHPDISLDQFLNESHPLEPILAALVPMEHVEKVLAALPGNKVVFSNGPQFYVEALVDAMNIGQYFQELFGTDRVGYTYKPDKKAYLTVCHILDVDPANCVMIDDSAANLETAKMLGMQTVWYGPKAHSLPYTDAIANKLTDLL